MGLRRAVVALGILGAGLPPSCLAVVDRPMLACVKHSNLAEGIGDAQLSLERAVAECCAKQKAHYFSIGGRKPGLGDGHHNLYQCAWDIKQLVGNSYEHIVDPSTCAESCPGDDMSYDVRKYGNCGGGCKGCASAERQSGHCGKFECGAYRVIYSCDVYQMDLGLGLRYTYDMSVIHRLWVAFEGAKKTPSWCEGKSKSGGNFDSNSGGGQPRSTQSGSTQSGSTQSGSSSYVAEPKKARGPLSSPPKLTIDHNPTHPENAKFYHPFYPKSLLAP